MKRKTIRVAPLLILAGSCLSLAGCHSRYLANRSADLRDIFQLGAGVTTENPKATVMPPSLGLHVQVTEFLNLGWMHYTGMTAEMDGRGLFAGPESRHRVGFGPYQRIRFDQDYADGSENYFKKHDTLWSDRMHSDYMISRKGTPAKELNYEDWAISSREGNPLMHRGWQYWENINMELSISEPFLTHWGVNLRIGFDPSEISDFVIGWLGVDYKHDDLTQSEFTEKEGPLDDSTQYKPSSDGSE